MRQHALSWPHALSVCRRNAAMYRRTWKLNILPNFFEPLFYLWSIGLGVGAYVSEMSGMSYVQFLAPGLVCVAAMNGASYEATYNVYVRMHYEKMYAAMLTTPIEPEDILIGELLWALIRASIYGGCFLLVTIAFGVAPFPRALLALPVIPLSGLLFAAIGLAFTLRANTMEFFSFYFTLFLTPLFLFSDIFFPLAERFSGPWLLLAEALPLLHPVRLSRFAFYGAHDGAPSAALLLWDCVYVLGLSAGLLLYARRWIRRRLTA
jgi:lipooligosaccharide transport system permease protein